MALTKMEKELLFHVIDTTKERKADIGAEAMFRLFKVKDTLKEHFSHMDLTHGSRDLRRHGAKVYQSLMDGIHHVDNLEDHLADLRDRHTNIIKVTTEDLKLLLNCFREVIASFFPGEFTDDTQAACDNYFNMFASALVPP